MATHKIEANLDVDGEVKGTSLDINGNADISGNLNVSGAITNGGNTTITLGAPKLILKDSTDDDDQAIIFRSSSDTDDYKIQTADFTSAATGDGLFIGSEGSDKVALVTNDTTALTIDTSQNATFAGSLTIPEYIYHSGDTTNYHRFLSNRQIFVAGNASSIDLNNGVSTFGSSSAATTLQGSSLAFTGAATFNSTIGSGAITSTGKIQGTELEGTSLDINGNADISGSTTVADIITSGHIYGRSVDGEYSNLYRMGGIYFTWDSDSYGTNFNHSITSTSNGSYGDNLTMNSYGKVRINFDSNSNDSADFSIGHHTTGTANTLLTLNDSGNLTITGELEATALDINGNADISGNLSGIDTLSAEQITIDGNSAGVPLYVRSTGTVSYVQIQNSSTGTSGTGDGFTIGANGTAAYLWQRENAVLHIGTNDTTAVTIDASQNATFAGSVTATSLDINGNADISGNLTGVDSITASATIQAEHLYSTDDLVVDDDATISGDLTVSGVTYGAYHSVVDDQYYFDDYNGSRNLSLFYKNARADIIRYQAVDNYEYWNGSAWVADSSQEGNIEKLLDGRQDTGWNVPARDYKFRFTTKATTSWPTMAMIWMQTSWSGSTYPGATMLVEEYDGSSWATKVTAEFTSTNGNTNWGLHSRADTALHTGNGSLADTTRITIDFYGWSPSNGSYVTIPLQNLMITSNYAGTENTDYTNLLDHNRDITIPGNIMHEDDTNTYFGFHAADQWRVVTNSTERFEVSNSGVKLGGTGATVSSIQDQDDMSSNSATALATQQSIKAYVDNQVALVAQATNLNAADDRDMAPEDYGYTNDLRIFFSSKEGLEDGSSAGSNYQDVLYLNSYSDASGGDANILAFDKSEMKIYHYQADQAASNWGTAKELAYTASPTFTGTPAAPTAGAGTNTTQLATTAFVTTAVSNLVDSAPGTLDTLNELAAALGDDASFSTTVTNSIAAKLPLAGGTMTGNIAHASDFTIDVGGDIILDADGAEVILADGGTQFANLKHNLGDFEIKSLVQDKDIKFIGNDNNSDVTALSLDMSDAGAAYFNSWIYTSGGGIGRDAHNVIDFSTDNQVTFKINNINQLVLNQSRLAPSTNDGSILGSASLGWSDLFLASGAVINFNNSDVTMTHSSNQLEVNGGNFVVQSNIECNDLDIGGTATGDGSGLTDLNGSQITTGTVAAARVATLNQNTTGSSGSCTGNAATATLAATSTIASDTGSATHFPVFVDGSTGARALKSHSSWNYNPGTSTLTAGKITTDTAAIVENAKSNSALMTLTGAGAGNEANISLKLAGTVHGSPIKMKLVAETTGGDPAGNGLLSYHPDEDTFGIGQTTTHNSMAILIDNNDVVSMKNETTFTNGIDVTSAVQSTSKTTGTVKVAGGVGIVKTLNVGEDVVAYASSDKRYKDNLQAIANPIDKVKSLTGYTFTWNDKHEQFNGNNDIGVVAQEVEKVLPEIVDTRDNGYKAVKYEKMVALLIEAVKDQQKQIDELKEKCNGCSK